MNRRHPQVPPYTHTTSRLKVPRPRLPCFPLVLVLHRGREVGARDQEGPTGPEESRRPGACNPGRTWMEKEEEEVPAGEAVLCGSQKRVLCMGCKLHSPA